MSVYRFFAALLLINFAYVAFRLVLSYHLDCWNCRREMGLTGKPKHLRTLACANCRDSGITVTKLSG